MLLLDALSASIRLIDDLSDRLRAGRRHRTTWADGMTFTCPACGFNQLVEEPWNGDSASDEICPSCGIHFGYDDAGGGNPERRRAIYRDWGSRWRDSGMMW